MRFRDVRQLLQLERPERDPVARRLRRCVDVETMRRLARRRMPRSVFDYADGGADLEIGLRANREAFEAARFRPLVLRDVGACDPAATLLGERFDLPLVLSPTGYTRMMHPEGEMAVARAAKAAALPYGLSTVSSTSIEGLATTGHPHLWFQLYLWRDREMAFDLVRRAEAAGYDVLELSVDVPVSGHRVRDVRNGLTIPPALRLGTLADISLHPSYWVSMLRADPIEFANAPPSIEGGVTIENMSAQFDPRLGWEDLEELRRRWPRKLLLKGPISADDAERALAAGVDGLHLSNHGGRQLDRTVPTLAMLSSVRERVGPEPFVIVDSGIRGGADLAVAIGRGADAGGIGRVYLYGLMVGGERGVAHALGLVRSDFLRTMQLLGVRSVAELREKGPELIA
jgi:L-lactate dehydrogenase (cytochrome)